MPEMKRPAFSYRSDPSVPQFDDRKTLFVFDGVCVLCSGGASWLMRHDTNVVVNFTSAQSSLGKALYAHYGLVMDETYLLIDQGRAYTSSHGYLRLCRTLGGWWHLFRLGAAIPKPWRDAAYGAVARNRYRWFGRTDYCGLLSEAQRQRLL